MPDEPIFGPARKSLPLWAVVLLGAACLCLAFLGAIVYPVVRSARFASTNAAALDNIRLLGGATRMYSNDYDEHFPPVMRSAFEVKPYLAPYLEFQDRDRVCISLNPAGGHILGDPRFSTLLADHIIGGDTLMMFYDDLPWGDRGLACYADGHAGFSPSFVTMMRSLTDDFGYMY